MIKRLSVSLIAFSIVLASPGLGAYTAFAQEVVLPARGGASAPPIVPFVPGAAAFSPASSLGQGFSGIWATLPSSALPGSPAAPAAGGSAGPASLSPSPVGSAARPSFGALPVLEDRGPAALAPASVRAGQLSDGVSNVLEKAGDIRGAQPDSAYSTGQSLQALVEGWRGRWGMDAPFARPRAAAFGDSSSRGGGEGWGVHLARPAGDSIRRGVEALADDVPPAPPAKPAPGGGSGGDKVPDVMKVVTAGFALLPALLSLPLLASGSLLAGGLVIAASVGVAALPFLKPATPGLFRRLPGLAVAALGLAALAGAFPALGAPAAAAAVAALSGWGLTRWAKTLGDNDRYDGDEVLPTFFSSIAATAAAGLILLSPAGWLVVAPAWAGLWAFNALSVVTSVAALVNFIHLPGWIGQGVTTVFEALYKGTRGTYDILTSIRRDTVLFKRLTNYTEVSVNKSPWSLIRLGLTIWLPVAVSETVQLVLAGAAGLALGLAQAPHMFLFGAVHKLWPKSKLAVFVSNAARLRFQFLQGSKVKLFNPVEKRLIPWANSRAEEDAPFKARAAARAKSLLGALGIRLAQLAWLGYAVTFGGGPVLVAAAALGYGALIPAVVFWPVVAASAAFMLTALAYAARHWGEAYNGEVHSPRAVLRLDKDVLPDEVPSEPRPKKVVGATLSKLIAVGIGLLPLYFIGLPLWAGAAAYGALVGPAALALYAGTALGVAFMPFMPEGPRSGAVRRAPGVLLLATGVLTLVTGQGLLMGLAGALGGWAFLELVGKLEKDAASGKENQRYSDDPAYLLAFVGALGLVTGLGLALTGAAPAFLSLFTAAGWADVPAALFTAAAYVLSPFLLYHLPRKFWKSLGKGLWTALQGLGYSVKKTYKVMDFWNDDARFGRNLKHHYRHWLNKSNWEWPRLVLWWAAHAVFVLADLAVGLGVGLAMGVSGAPLYALALVPGALAYGALRLPSLFLWGAAYELYPDSKGTRFIAGFNRSWLENSEGSKESFDRWVKPLIGAIDESAGESGRPSLKAAGALALARVLQLLWLLRITVGAPWFILRAVVDGFRNASGAKPKPPEGEWKPDPDDPDRLL